MKHLFLFLAGVVLYAGNFLSAQETIFHQQVKVEFEKTVAVRALYKEIEPEWYDQIKDRLPENMLSYFNFIGDQGSNTSIYKKGREVQRDSRVWFRPFADDNIVYNNYNSGTTVTAKQVFEKTFLLKDSLLPIKWHLTADTRVIAGYECRKAVGILYDSIAVFAFYSEELLVTGGPEGVQGLPGMILGVGVPRIHTTWFATNAEVNNVPTAEIKAPNPKKTDASNRTEMMGQLIRVMKECEGYGEKLSLAFLI